MDNWDNNYEQRKPNFVMVGEPSPKAETEPAPSPEPAAQTRHTGQTVYTGQTVHTDQGDQGEPVYGNNSYTYYQQTPPVPPKKKKKEPKYITRRAFVVTLICCMLATSGLTIGGYTLLSDNGIISGGGKTVSATNYTLAKATGSEKSVQEIIAQNENAVVEIRTESVAMDNWLQNYVTQGAGSGVIVDTKGYILTCNHVIDGASKITVTLKDGTELEAKLVGGDAQNDIAVLKVNAKNLTAATYGDSSSLSVGDMVVAIGNPLGQLGGSASSGIISALDRTITVEGREMTLLQTDTSINPGNSGGGLFDQYGNLIGIVVAKSSGSDVEGLGFAIPIAKAAEIAKDLIENGHVTNRAAIGISVLDASSAEVAMQYGLRMTGVYIQEVTGDEAQKAGFKAGDMIYYVGDTKIENQASLVSALNKQKPGDKIKVTVIRDNQTVEITTTLVEATE
ncbi:MAG: trypsin-like peptidase domain-containing protein [Emergencia sp.]|nr:trypsin-like peptidase domain-containing protein [Emergencia sp.]